MHDPKALVEQIQYLLEEIRRERANPNRLAEYYAAACRMVPLAEQAAVMIEKQQARAK